MIKSIPPEERKNKRCHYCETWVAVKHMVHTDKLDRVYYGMKGYVPCCEKCIARHYVEIEE